MFVGTNVGILIPGKAKRSRRLWLVLLVERSNLD